MSSHSRCEPSSLLIQERHGYRWENATDVTGYMWPFSSSSTLPVAFQIRTVISFDPEATRLPSWENETDVTESASARPLLHPSSHPRFGPFRHPFQRQLDGHPGRTQRMSPRMCGPLAPPLPGPSSCSRSKPSRRVTQRRPGCRLERTQ